MTLAGSWFRTLMLQGLPTVSRAVIHLEESKTAGEKYKLFVEGDNLRYALFMHNFPSVRKKPESIESFTV